MHTWPFPEQQFSDAVNALPDGEAGALVGWARHAVDALHYLGDVDERVFGDPQRPAFGHRLQVVDLAHMSWACITAITALDRCAAAAWRMAIPRHSGHEKDVRDFDTNAHPRVAAKNRAKLDTVSVAWVDRVLADDAYLSVHLARKPMTHARLGQIHYAGNVVPGPHEQRSAFTVGAGGAEVGSRALIEMSVDLATRHVEGFVTQVVL